MEKRQSPNVELGSQDGSVMDWSVCCNKGSSSNYSSTTSGGDDAEASGFQQVQPMSQESPQSSGSESSSSYKEESAKHFKKRRVLGNSALSTHEDLYDPSNCHSPGCNYCLMYHAQDIELNEICNRMKMQMTVADSPATLPKSKTANDNEFKPRLKVTAPLTETQNQQKLGETVDRVFDAEGRKALRQRLFESQSEFKTHYYGNPDQVPRVSSDDSVSKQDTTKQKNKTQPPPSTVKGESRDFDYVRKATGITHEELRARYVSNEYHYPIGGGFPYVEYGESEFPKLPVKGDIANYCLISTNVRLPGGVVLPNVKRPNADEQ